MNQMGVKPTLRSLFYWAADAEGLIVHSQVAYRSLSRYYARFREKLGQLDVLEDRSRRFLLNDVRIAESLDGYLKNRLSLEIWSLENTVWRLPKWYGQPRKVELWIEKEAVTVLEDIASELGVDAFPSRGFSSVTKLYEAAERIKDATRRGLKVHIIILTDFDPSGFFIDINYRKKLREYGAEAEFERLMITPEIIRRYGLPSIPPDDPSYTRVTKDPRYSAWLDICREQGISPEPVELDAFVGLYPEEFRRLIVEVVNKYFDPQADAERRRLEEERKQQALKIAEKLRRFIEEIGES